MKDKENTRNMKKTTNTRNVKNTKNTGNTRKKRNKKTNQGRVYKILIILILISVMICIHNFYKNKDDKKNIEVSSEPIKEKPIDSSTKDWNLMLVNKDNAIPKDYKVETTRVEGRWDIDIRVKDALENMLADARKQGLAPLVCSAYRTSEYQTNLFNKKVNEYKRKGYAQKEAEEQAAVWVTIPGTSEHELGLSLDIVGVNYQILDEKQEDTEIQKWLMEHCYEYGFILRYPTDKKDITKINYEPWHYRYVGIKDAMFIKEKEFCLEEYIEFLKEYEN